MQKPIRTKLIIIFVSVLILFFSYKKYITPYINNKLFEKLENEKEEIVSLISSNSKIQININRESNNNYKAIINFELVNSNVINYNTKDWTATETNIRIFDLFQYNKLITDDYTSYYPYYKEITVWDGRFKKFDSSGIITQSGKYYIELSFYAPEYKDSKGYIKRKTYKVLIPTFCEDFQEVSIITKIKLIRQNKIITIAELFNKDLPIIINSELYGKYEGADEKEFKPFYFYSDLYKDSWKETFEDVNINIIIDNDKENLESKSSNGTDIKPSNLIEQNWEGKYIYSTLDQANGYEQELNITKLRNHYNVKYSITSYQGLTTSNLICNGKVENDSLKIIYQENEDGYVEPFYQKLPYLVCLWYEKNNLQTKWLGQFEDEKCNICFKKN